METHGVPWEAVYWVDLATTVRFKIMRKKVKKHNLILDADVEVHDHDKKVYKKGIRLWSSFMGPKNNAMVMSEIVCEQAR